MVAWRSTQGWATTLVGSYPCGAGDREADLLVTVAPESEMAAWLAAAGPIKTGKAS